MYYDNFFHTDTKNILILTIKFFDEYAHTKIIIDLKSMIKIFDD